MTAGPDDKGPLDAVAAPAQTPPPETRVDASPVESDAVVHTDVEQAQQLAAARADGTAPDLHVEMPSSVRVDKDKRRAYEAAAAAGRTGQFAIEQRGGNAVLLPEGGGR